MKLYIDYDGTLNDMNYSWINWLNFKNNYETIYTIKAIDSWEWFSTNNEECFDWFKNHIPYSLNEAYRCRPLKGSQQFYSILKKIFNKDCYILTSPLECFDEKTNKQLKADKYNHIYHYYKELNVIQDYNKWNYATENSIPNILVDDKVDNCLKFIEAGGKALLFNYRNEYEYNRDSEDLKVCITYEEVIEQLTTLIKEIEDEIS
jgi:hypothetical protein